MKFLPDRLNHLFLCLVILGVLCSCTSTPEGVEDTVFEVVSVQRGTLSTRISATGSVFPKSEVTLAFQIGGQVQEVAAQMGDRVAEGQVLAQLDVGDLQLQVQSAEAGLQVARAQLAQLQQGGRPEEIAALQAQLDAAEAALSQAAAQRDQLTGGALDAEIASAEAQVASAMAQQKAALNLHDRMMQCQTVRMPNGEKKEICPTLGDPEEEARYNWHAAEVALAAAQSQLDALVAGKQSRLRAAEAAVLSASAQRDVALAQLNLLTNGTTVTETAAAEASVTQAEVALESAHLNLERAVLTAPFDGVLAQVFIAAGAFVGPQTPAFVLVDDAQFRVEGDVDEADIGVLAVEQQVQITLDAFPGQALAGRIIAISPAASVAGGIVSYRVVVALDATDLQLRSGMTASMEITKEAREDVLLIPNRAIWIDSNSGRPFVEKLVNDEVMITYIEQGAVNEEFSEVLAGLEDGDQLAVRSTSIRDRFREVLTNPVSSE